MRNWLIKVESQETESMVVMPDTKTALGVINTFMLEGAYVSVCETQSPVTHKTGAAAEAFIRLRVMQVELPIMRAVDGGSNIHRGTANACKH